jgi:hypothetical protein
LKQLVVLEVEIKIDADYDVLVVLEVVDTVIDDMMIVAVVGCLEHAHHVQEYYVSYFHSFDDLKK